MYKSTDMAKLVLEGTNNIVSAPALEEFIARKGLDTRMIWILAAKVKTSLSLDLIQSYLLCHVIKLKLETSGIELETMQRISFTLIRDMLNKIFLS